MYMIFILKGIHETKLELSERAGGQTQFPLWGVGVGREYGFFIE